MSHDSQSLVLVTGGSGFVAVWCINYLLAADYRVRTTVRSLKREKDVRKMLEESEAKNIDRVSFVEADLSKDEGWKEAVEGCTYVLHVASPFPAGAPKHEDDLIVPAREGTLRVLRASRDAGVKRVVVTSSTAAIAYGREDVQLFNEEIWTNTDSPAVHAYAKSKTLAERAAWDFIKNEGGSLEMSVINPGGVYGPVLGPDFATSVLLIQRLMNGSLPGVPQLEFALVDVRDVADLHLRAMTDAKANGERFLCLVPPAMSVQEISLGLRKNLGQAAKKCPTRQLPNFVLKLIALFDPAVGLIVPELGKTKQFSNDKAKNVLGWQPRSGMDACVASGESLIKYGLV